MSLIFSQSLFRLKTETLTCSSTVGTDCEIYDQTGIDGELITDPYGQGILEIKIKLSGCQSTGCLRSGQ